MSVTFVRMSCPLGFVQVRQYGIMLEIFVNAVFAATRGFGDEPMNKLPTDKAAVKFGVEAVWTASAKEQVWDRGPDPKNANDKAGVVYADEPMVKELENAYHLLAGELNGKPDLVVKLMRWWYGGREVRWQNMDGMLEDSRPGLIGLDFAMTTNTGEPATAQAKIKLCKARLGGLTKFREFLVVLIKRDTVRSFTVDEATGDDDRLL